MTLRNLQMQTCAYDCYGDELNKMQLNSATSFFNPAAEKENGYVCELRLVQFFSLNTKPVQKLQ